MNNSTFLSQRRIQKVKVLLFYVFTCQTRNKTPFNKFRRIFSPLMSSPFIMTSVFLVEPLQSFLILCLYHAGNSFLETTKLGNHIHPIILCHNNKTTIHNIFFEWWLIELVSPGNFLFGFMYLLWFLKYYTLNTVLRLNLQEKLALQLCDIPNKM